MKQEDRGSSFFQKIPHLPASAKKYLWVFLVLLIGGCIVLHFTPSILPSSDRFQAPGSTSSATLPPPMTEPPPPPWKKLTVVLPWELYDRCPCELYVQKKNQPHITQGPSFLMFPLNIEGMIPALPNYKGQKSNSDLAYMDFFASKGNLYADLLPPNVGLSPATAVGHALTNNLIEDIGKNIILVARRNATCSALRIAKLVPDMIKGVIIVMPIKYGYNTPDESTCTTTRSEVPVLAFYPKTGDSYTMELPNKLKQVLPNLKEVRFDRARKDEQYSVWDNYLDVFYHDLFHAKVSEWLANGMK